MFLCTNEQMATRQPEESQSYGDFFTWTKTTLKDFLDICGLKQIGSKAELIERAFGACKLNAPVKFSQEQIARNIKKEYHKRLETKQISTDPVCQMTHGKTTCWIGLNSMMVSCLVIF
jgi:hypothetical protein